jgi:hypothetical protein
MMWTPYGEYHIAPTSIEVGEQQFALCEITDHIILERIFALRVTAWRTKINIPCSTTSWRDSYDATGRHWAIMIAGGPVAAARLTVHNHPNEVPNVEVYGGAISNLPSPTCSLNRCVVHPNFRRLGLSRKLDKVRVLTAVQLGCRSIVGTVSDSTRAKALESCRFTRIGAGIPYPDGILKGHPNIIYVLHLTDSKSAGLTH